MAEKTKTDAFLEAFQRQPQRVPKAVRKHERDVFGIVEFPTKVTLMIMQEVFSVFSTWRYTDDLSTTKIYIQDQYPSTGEGDAQRPELKPAIITARQTLSLASVPHGRRNDTGTFIDPKTRNRILTFTRKLSVPMVVHCVSKKGPEAERIAALVFAVLETGEDTFKRRGCDAIMGHSVGAEGIFVSGAEAELISVPVSFQMEYTWSWARLSDGPEFKTAEIDVQDP